jgi:hypothetical protein
MKKLLFVVFAALVVAVGASADARAQQCEPSIALDFHAEEIVKSTAEVRAYDPAKGGRMVHESNDNYVLYAISKKDRDEWLGRWKDFQRGSTCDKVDPALDELAVAVKEKMGKAMPRAADFQFHDPAAERVIMTLFEDSKTIKVNKIGLDSAGWSIQRGDNGLPSYRYKDGFAWVKDTSENQPYCHLYSVRVKEDYAGGGTYNTKMYRSSAQDSIIGCPAK